MPLRRLLLHGGEPHARVLQLCGCSIRRKTAYGGSYAINIMGTKDSLTVSGQEAPGLQRATIDEADGSYRISTGERHFCARCATALWLWDATWPKLVHRLASAIDTDLPMAHERSHMLLRFKPMWVEPRIGTDDKVFDLYPDESIADWHKVPGLWVA